MYREMVPMEDYKLDVLVQGYPGKSVCHGGMGWSTIALLQGGGHVALIDVGTFSHRASLISGLEKHGLVPAQVTDVILTHAHHDHAINWCCSRKHGSGSLLSGRDRDIIFTGEAAKNRAEFLTRRADMTYDPAVTALHRNNVGHLAANPGTLLVPGHDLPMVLEDGRPVFVGKREAAITSWYDDDLETTTRFELTVGR
jgi:glyoxylase-like metal-dependent hydrolase (beta-lactamase superfamily II)